MISWTLINKTQTAEAAVRKEIAIMKKLKHPNVVKLVEVIDQEDDDAIYLVMEYAGKHSLQAKMKKSKIPSVYIWNYFRDALRGLLYCHEEAGVVHRDIKPENLLITKDIEG